MDLSVVILAAGQGTRMVSSLPKVLHPLCGQPLISYSLHTASSISDKPPIVVVGHEADEVRAQVGDKARFALQDKQLGTGHALMAAETLLRGEQGMIMVIAADMPLLSAETLKSLAGNQSRNSGPITMLTVRAADARGFGRIIRAEDNRVVAIVEEAQATAEQLAISELNVGAYCFDASWVWNGLKRIPISSKGEYYLTDLVGIAVEEGREVRAAAVSDADEAIGINTRAHLAEAEAILRRKINHAWMLAGVSMTDPLTTYIDANVKIGKDTTIYPNTHLRNGTQIGESSKIGPNSIIEGSIIGDRCIIQSSVIDGGVMMEDDVFIGSGTLLVGPVRIGKSARISAGAVVLNDVDANTTLMGERAQSLPKKD